LANLDFPLPLEVFWQANRGDAIARNAGLARANGDLVLFVDDDMEPAPGWLARHRKAHALGHENIVVGPCLIPDSASTVISQNKVPADRVHARLAATGMIRDREDFTAANTSGPADLFRRIGGFYEGFRGWGAKDVELGARLLAAQVQIRYDAAAVLWHHQRATVATLCANARSEAANRGLLVRLHTDLLDEVQPVRAQFLRARWFAPIARATLGVVARLPSPLRAAFASLLASPARAEAALSRGRSERLIRFSTGASALLGAAEGDRGGGYLGAKLARSGTHRAHSRHA
jgi:glycosyltransferase involved in cell wall biosynthesis